MKRGIKSLKTSLRMKCLACGRWNRVPANKIFTEQPSPEPKVKIIVPMYEPLKVVKCKKCGGTIAQPQQLIRITRLKPT
ncbi:MAG: hypothetical protein QXX08_04685 [Candidatus Bathyarchaeia archaeon]